MTFYDVLLNADVPECERLGIPGWPRHIKEVPEGTPLPDAPWIRISGEELDLNRQSLVEQQRQWFVDHAPPAPGTRTMTPLAFRDRFTEEEEIIITQAAGQFPSLRVWLDRLNAATEISLDDPRTVMGLQTMAMVGLLEPRRVIEILSGG